MSMDNRLTYLNKNFPIARVASFLLGALIISSCAVKEYKVSHHQVVGVEGEMGANMMPVSYTHLTLPTSTTV